MPIAQYLCIARQSCFIYYFFSPRETVPIHILERVNYCTRTENRERNVTLQCYIRSHAGPDSSEYPLHPPPPVTSVVSCKSVQNWTISRYLLQLKVK